MIRFLFVSARFCTETGKKEAILKIGAYGFRTTEIGKLGSGADLAPDSAFCVCFCFAFCFVFN